MKPADTADMATAEYESPSEGPEITADDALKEMLAKCKPGTSKPYKVIAAMGEDGVITLSPDTSAPMAKPAPAAPAKKPKRPPVIAAVMG